MRQALLPAGGDPFLLAYWLRHYAQLWADEVDHLRIAVCGTAPEAMDYITTRVGEVPHASVEFLPRTEHGSVLRYLVDTTSADHVMFCEDDAFVREPGVVDSRFGVIESLAVDVVGTARTNASPNLVARAEERFGPPPRTESGETGLSLYPCFLFIRRSDIPDGVLGGRSWGPGEYLPALDYTTVAEEGCDTFTYPSWELRARGLRISSESAYRSDSAHSGPGRRNVDGGENRGHAPWFHVGSLSTGYGMAFMAGTGPEAYAGLVRDVSRPSELYDWHKRMSWWTRIADCTQGELPAFHDRYDAELWRFMTDVGADHFEVTRWRRAYDPLVTWREC